MTDLVLPAAVPMETYIDDTVAVLSEVLEDTPADVLGGFDFTAQGVWAFARPGSPPLKLDQSLDDAGVVDGSLLTLVSVSRTERYRPLVEDVIDAIAVLDESPEFDRTALNRFVGAAIPLLTAPVIGMAMRAWWETGRSLWWPLAIGILGIAVLVGSFVANRFYQSGHLAECLLVTTYLLIATAAALAVPLPRGVNSLGAPQVAGAATAVLFLTLMTRGGPRKRHELASFAVITAIAVIAAAAAFGYGYQDWVPAGGIAFGLFIVTNAAKLTVAVARIALPPIPVPGETVDNEELLDPVATPEATSEETPTWQAIIASVPASAVRLTERSKLAKQLLIGYVTSGTLILAAGAIAVVVRGHFFVHSLVVAGLITTVCGFRSRLYAERWCAWALLAATVAIPTGLTAKLIIWYLHYAWLLLSVYLTVALVALVVVGSMAHVRRVSPVVKRTLELIDGAMIAAIIPMLLWITGVYDTVRNIRFRAGSADWRFLTEHRGHGAGLHTFGARQIAAIERVARPVKFARWGTRIGDPAMAEPLAVDPTGLSAAAAKLAGLVFPQPPAPIAVSGTDSVVAAINETMPSIESLVSDGLPGVKAALTRTASNMNAAADVYAKTDQSLGTSLSQYAFGSSGEGLAGVASVGGQPSQATQLLSTPVSQVTTQLGETAAELAPRVVATVPQLVQLAPHAVQMSQNASPIAQTISQTAQQAAQSAQGGSGPMPAQLASAEKPATEQAEPVHEVTNDDQGDQGDVQPAEVVAAARDEGAGASPGQQPGGGVPAQAMDTGAGARPAASPLAAPVDPSTPAPSTTTTL